MITVKNANYNTFANDRIDSETGEQNVETTSERHGGETIEWLRSSDIKNLIAIWLLGLCTDFGYWIILSSAHDLISLGETPGSSPKSSSGRNCNQLSAGVILIVNVVPNFVMKSFLPFLPLWIHARIFIAITLSIVGFAIAACNQMRIYMLSGLALCSVAVGIWTSSLLMYIPAFKDDKIVKAWCSGCGSSGFLASLSYLLLTFYGISLSSILSCMMVIPVLISVIFWFLLDHPIPEQKVTSYHRYSTTKLTETLKIILRLMFFYSTPYFLVFFFQYLINQGLFELIYIKNSFIDLATQVRLLTFIYLFAVLLSSSISFVTIDFLWFMVFLQGTNLALFTSESVYGWAGNNTYGVWIVVSLTFWEGLIAGCSYMNTYRRINNEIPSHQRQFSMSINSIGASLGMTFAGFAAIPLHNYICNLPPPF